MTQDWHILGAGAIGSLFASSFHHAGISTRLLCRVRGPDTQNISIDENGTSTTFSLPTSYNGETGDINKLLVTTKAYDVRSALSDIEHRLNASSHIVILVNGMGFMDELATNFPELQFTAGTTTEGAYRVGSDKRTGHFCHAGNGLTRIGHAGLTEPPGWFEDWSHINLPAVWENNIEHCLWQKLSINCAINPVCALHRCTNGALASQPELARLVTQLCDEIAQVSLAAGYKDTSRNIHHWVAEVIASTRHNRSSMLQDVLSGQRTENDYISGYFLAIAGQLGVATPHNRTIYESVLALDRPID